MSMNTQQLWPELNYQKNKETYDTLHLWFQVVGKIKLTKMAWVNHSWHVALYVSERGFTTAVMHEGPRAFTLEFDLVDHFLNFKRSDGDSLRIPLRTGSVAAFYEQCLKVLSDAGIECTINDRPNEVIRAIPFSEDRETRRYDPAVAHDLWIAFLQADRLMKDFRSDFEGKASPVHFFWGSMDLAVTRFSGRRAPEHPGGFPNLPDLVTREAYSHEVSSCGFWPGNEMYPEAAFYSYAYPMPKGFETARVRPGDSFFHQTMKEYLLPYERVRQSLSPDAMVEEFFQSTYAAAANLGHWDRKALEACPYLEEIHHLRRQASA